MYDIAVIGAGASGLMAAIFALKENFSSSMNTVVLLHLSNGNSNDTMFKSRVSEELGFFNVHIASKGLKIELNKEDF
jgi:succinate dehydrogenase/fumarate reductase flavoprotein subunit